MTEVDVEYIIQRMRDLLNELDHNGVSEKASYSLDSAYDTLKHAVRRNRCQDLED
jgi:hypothetical protein